MVAGLGTPFQSPMPTLWGGQPTMVGLCPGGLEVACLVVSRSRCALHREALPRDVLRYFDALHGTAKLSSAMHCWDTLTRHWRRTWQHLLHTLPLWTVLRSSLRGPFNYVGALMVAQLGGYV